MPHLWIAGIAGLCLSFWPMHAQDLSEIFAGVARQTSRNAKITGLRFQCIPADCRVRPLETLVLRVLVDGEIPVQGSDPRRGRIQRAPGPSKVVEPGGGYVSKPYKHNGDDPGGILEASNSTIGNIFSKVAGDFIVQDSFLYTAPATAGEYTVRNETEGFNTTVKIRVTPEAPSRSIPETVAFGPEPGTAQEPYRTLAEYWAPVLAQETWFQPKSDMIARFDFDNDLIGDNNWDNLEMGSSQAYVYYAAMETATHWFLIYNAFHPRDYSDKCVAGSCHENDNEGLILTVEKDGSEFGKLILMETLAHNNVYTHTNERNIGGGLHNIEGPIEFLDRTHPVVFIEAGGHGIYGSADAKYTRYNVAKDQFTAGTGITYIYKGAAERPRHPDDRRVGYELLPILSHWWSRTKSGQNQRMFDEFAAYAPFGGRPGVKAPLIGTTFLGRKESANKAKPFWGWHDNRTLKNNVLAVGQWGLDPAYAVSRSVRLPASMRFSQDYTYNPYLGVGEEAPPPSAVIVTAGTPVVGAPATPPAPAPAPTEPAPANPTPAVATPILPATLPGSGSTAPAANPEPQAGAVLPPAVATPAPAPAAPPANEGTIEIEASVDGTAVFLVTAGRLFTEVLAGQPVQNPRFQISGTMPTGPGWQWTLEKRSGRGTATITDQPTTTGNLKVRVDDPRGGADRYQLRIRWRRQ